MPVLGSKRLVPRRLQDVNRHAVVAGMDGPRAGVGAQNRGVKAPDVALRCGVVPFCCWAGIEALGT